jgi:UV radiation resistance-associated gene protein
VRNLSLVSASSHRVWGKTTTDENVEYTLKSPTKFLGQNEVKSLHQTRSFTDLKSSKNGGLNGIQKSSSTKHNDASEANGRPAFGKGRRRSTLYWTGTSPEIRQRKLEDVVSERMADSWFSLHVAGQSEPTYISEVIEKSMNPTFRFFDLNMNNPQTARAEEVHLKLWAKTDKLHNFFLLMEIHVCLKSLQFIGKSLDNFRQPLPANCTLFHFEDGTYTSLTDILVHKQPITSLYKGSTKTGITRPDRTSSYDALMRLANTDDCIQDALATRAKVEEDINGLLRLNRESLDILAKQRQAKEALNAVQQATSNEQRQIQSLRKKRDDMLASLNMRRDAIQTGRKKQNRSESGTRHLQKAIHDNQTQSEKSLDDSRAQIRRICEGLELIYPLEPIRNRPLQFTIRNIHLPNSVFDDTNRDEVAAALGFTATLTHMLSVYLSTPLPYPIFPDSSNSMIEDPISAAITQRKFPLYLANVSYKFEYGVFLLNKDIEFLMNKNGLRILDIRHTLPNLKYLMYVLTAGTGELPARKAGGIRALGTGQVRPTISRKGSEESVHSSVGFNSVKLVGGAIPAPTRHSGHAVEVNGKEKAAPEESEVPGRLLPAPSAKTHA